MKDMDRNIYKISTTSANKDNPVVAVLNNITQDNFNHPFNTLDWKEDDGLKDVITQLKSFMKQ
jgi:hypothetical protein